MLLGIPQWIAAAATINVGVVRLAGAAQAAMKSPLHTSISSGTAGFIVSRAGMTDLLL
jgi:hypothetical protein